jgi:prepilin-type N-terminal cleavage/methylation domain-containing protein
MNRHGFTLIELIIGMTVMAIVGIALTRILISDSRFVSRQEAMLNARQVSRAGMTGLVAELRMVSDSGVVSATPDSIRVRVPYAFGMACRSTGSYTYVSLAPPDSLAYAAATASGIAWRESSGTYSRVAGVTVATVSDSSQCTADGIRVITGGDVVTIAPATSIPSGSIVYLYQDLTYRFYESGEFPGRIGLWRKAGTSAYEELVAPFDTSSGFGFLLGETLIPSDTVPANLETIYGVELRLIGASETPPQGSSEHVTFSFVTRVPFQNKS